MIMTTKEYVDFRMSMEEELPPGNPYMELIIGLVMILAVLGIILSSVMVDSAVSSWMTESIENLSLVSY